MSERGQRAGGSGQGEKQTHMLAGRGWAPDARLPRVPASRGRRLAAPLLRHQLTVPRLCLFVTKDTVLPTYK